MELHRRCAPAHLSTAVLEMIGYCEQTPAEIRQVEAAALVVPLIINFGEPFWIGLGREPDERDRIPSFAAGLFAGPVHIRSFGRSCCLQINFTPLGAYRFFKVPLAELTDTMVPIADIMDTELAALARCLEDLASWEQRFDIAEAFVTKRLACGRSPARETALAYEAILRSSGQLSIGRIAQDIGRSRKHLVRRFRDEIGLTPKAIARIVRFNRAQELAGTTPRLGWADIAAACGYSDQAHLVREFRAFAGSPPTIWMSQRGR